MLLLDHLGTINCDFCELYRRIWVEVVVIVPISMWQLVYANRMREYLGLFSNNLCSNKEYMIYYLSYVTYKLCYNIKSFEKVFYEVKSDEFNRECVKSLLAVRN